MPLLRAALLWLLLPRRALPWIALLRPALPWRILPQLAPLLGLRPRAAGHVITGHPVPEAGGTVGAPGGVADGACGRAFTGGVCGYVGTGACCATGCLDLVLGLVPIFGLMPVLGVVPVLVEVPGAGDAGVLRLPSLRAAAGLGAFHAPRSVVRARPTVARAVRALAPRVLEDLRRPGAVGVFRPSGVIQPSGARAALGTLKMLGIACGIGTLKMLGIACAIGVPRVPGTAGVLGALGLSTLGFGMADVHAVLGVAREAGALGIPSVARGVGCSVLGVLGVLSLGVLDVPKVTGLGVGLFGTVGLGVLGVLGV
ncbi:MAG: hypothetical protein IRZ07_00830, partial [Microbispora sp.]|nr:hypothetical protein [Microbispora sp.]